MAASLESRKELKWEMDGEVVFSMLEAAEPAKYKINLAKRKGYDHSELDKNLKSLTETGEPNRPGNLDGWVIDDFLYESHGFKFK
jgi:hypothetical protein